MFKDTESGLIHNFRKVNSEGLTSVTCYEEIEGALDLYFALTKRSLIRSLFEKKNKKQESKLYYNFIHAFIID